MLGLLSKLLWGLGFAQQAVGDGGQASVMCRESAYCAWRKWNVFFSASPAASHFTFPEASLRMGLF